MKTFNDCTHYFFYSEKQEERIYWPLWMSRGLKEDNPLPTFKGNPYTDMREIGTGWSDWDDAVYLGAGTIEDAAVYHPGKRFIEEPRPDISDVLHRMTNIGKITTSQLFGVGCGLMAHHTQFQILPEASRYQKLFMAEAARMQSERLKRIVEDFDKMVDRDRNVIRAKKLTDQLASVLRVCYSALCTYGSHPIIGAYVNKLLKEYDDDATTI